jgi:hypothetical protein
MRNEGEVRPTGHWPGVPVYLTHTHPITHNTTWYRLADAPTKSLIEIYKAHLLRQKTRLYKYESKSGLCYRELAQARSRCEWLRGKGSSAPSALSTRPTSGSPCNVALGSLAVSDARLGTRCLWASSDNRLIERPAPASRHTGRISCFPRKQANRKASTQTEPFGGCEDSRLNQE